MISGSPAQTTVAVCPTTPGPGITASIAELVTQALVTAAARLPNKKILDRSAFARICSEQDIVLTSQWSTLRTGARDSLGADEMLVSTVLRDPPQIIISVRRVEVMTGQVLGSILRRESGTTRMDDVCSDIVRTLWQSEKAETTGAHAPTAYRAELESVWRLIDQPIARGLIGSEVQRAESVYRQYLRASTDPTAEELNSLETTALSYLTDCLELLQRAQNPPDGMVFVPEGQLEIAYPGTKPRRFEIGGFFVDRCPLTRRQYAAFLASTGAAGPAAQPQTDEGLDLPLVNIDWYEAKAIAQWRGMELPTYPQWLRAVSGDGKRPYPWGSNWQPDACNHAADPNRPVLEPVGSHPTGKSPFGVLDGAGCVFEWLATAHQADYWLRAPLRNPAGPDTGARFLTVGGSFRSGPTACSCQWINPLPPNVRQDDVGFRCALSLK